MKIQATDVSNLLAVLAAKAPLNAPAFTGNATFASNVAITGTLSASNYSGTSSGSNTGDQTTITGNAGTATKLAMPRTLAISGDLVWTSPNFDGSANVTAIGTLATVNANVGTFGSSAAVPVLSVNAKGLVTAVSTAALGTAAVKNIGTSGNTVPVLDGTNTWSSDQTFGNINVNGNLVVTGTTTNINATNLNVSDAIINLANNNTTGTVPYIGIKAERGTNDAYLVWDESWQGWTAQTATADDMTGRAYAAIKGIQIWATATGGNAPFIVASTAMVSNLNVELLGGLNSAYYLNASNLTGTLSAARLPATSGDVSSAAGSSVYTLASVNSNVGSFGSAAAVPIVTVNAKGLVTAVSTAPLGTAAVANTGTSGNTVPFLDGANYWTTTQNFGGPLSVNGSGGSTVISYASGEGGKIQAALGLLLQPGGGNVTIGGSLAVQGTATASNLSGTNTGDQSTITGNSGTATKLQTARTLAITGDLAYTSPAFDGTGNVTATGTLATVNANVGTYGSGAAVPILTVNAKGLVTAVATAGLGSAALKNIGTSGNTVPVLDGANTWSALQTASSGLSIARATDSTTDYTTHALTVYSGASLGLSLGVGAGSAILQSWGSRTLSINPAGNPVTVGSSITASNLSGTNTGDQTITLTGDVTGSGTGSFSTTLATVNSSVGNYGNTAGRLVPLLTIDAKGRITSASEYQLGTAAAKNTGTSGNTVPLLDGNNTWSATQTFPTIAVSGPGAQVGFTTRSGTTNWALYSGANDQAALYNSVGNYDSHIFYTDGRLSLRAGLSATTGTFSGAVSASNLSGTNTGDQTTITGNAGSATRLINARTISSNGDVSWTTTFDGTANTSGTSTLATVNSNVGTYGSATIVPVVTVNGKGLITSVNPVTITSPKWGIFPAGQNASVAAVDARTVSNPATGLGYASGVRFRFSSINDDNGGPYADVIDLSTYQDASGGGLNALYFQKGIAHKIIHKRSNDTDSSTWISKTLAYTDSDITGGAARLTTARTISASGDFTWSVSFDGTGNASSPATLATVNANVGTYGSFTTRGSNVYLPQITVDAKGRVTGISQAVIGTAAGYNVGQSGNTVPTLDAGNTWSAQQFFGNISATWVRGGGNSGPLSILEADGSTGYLTGYNVTSGSFSPLTIRGSTITMNQLTGGLGITSTYANAMYPGGVRMASTIPGISWDVSATGVTNNRNYALLNNYSNNGRLELLYSTSVASNPSVIALTVDGLNNLTTFNMPVALAGNLTFNTIRGQLVGQYDAGNTQGIWAMGDPYKLTPGGGSTTYGNHYGLAWSYNPDYGTAGNNPQSKPGLNHQLLVQMAGITKTAIGEGIWTSGNLTVSQNATVSGLLQTNNGFTAYGTISLSGAVTATSMSVQGNLTASNGFTAYGTINLSSAVSSQSLTTTYGITAGNGFTAYGAINLSGNTAVTGTLGTTGDITISNAGKAILKADLNGGSLSFQNNSATYLGQFNLQGSGMYLDAIGPQVFRNSTGTNRAFFSDSGGKVYNSFAISSRDNVIADATMEYFASNYYVFTNWYVGNGSQNFTSVYNTQVGSFGTIYNGAGHTFRSGNSADKLVVNSSGVTISGNFTTQSITTNGFQANIADGNIRASAGYSNATPGLTVASGSRSFALVAGASGSALAYDNGGQFVIGTDSMGNLSGNNVGGGVVPVATFAANGTVSFTGNISAPNLVSTSAINTFTTRQVISAPDQAIARLNINNTNSTGNRTFSLVAGVNGETQEGFSIYDGAASATRLVIGNDGAATFRGSVAANAATFAGNITGTADNTFLAIDGVFRAGITKKAGFGPMFTHANNYNFIIARSSGTTIDAANTFTPELTIDNSGYATFAQPISVTGSAAQYGAGVAAGFYGDANNVAVRTLNSSSSGIYLQSYAGAQTFATITPSLFNVNVPLTVNAALTINNDPVVSSTGRTIKFAAANKAVGWYTVATNNGTRAFARFGLRDTVGGAHQSVVFYASHHYGNGNTINVLSEARYSASPFRYLRIKRGGTYDGAMLQVYIDQSSNDIEVYVLGDNFQSDGWVLKNWVADGTDPGGLGVYANVTTADYQIDLDTIANGSGGSGPSQVGSLYVGRGTATPVTSPTFIKMDNNFISTTGDRSNLKFFLYDGGGGDTYGFGLNNDSGVEYHASGTSVGKHRFYVGGSLRGMFNNNGLDMGNFPVYSTNADFSVRVKFGGTSSENIATYTTSNGNLHLDPAGGSSTYINWYRGNDLNISNGSQAAQFKFSGDTLTHPPTGGVYLRNNQAQTITVSNTFTPVQNVRDGFINVGLSGNSNVTSPSVYQWGYQEAGAWSHPYPDLVFGFHTGMKFGALPAYGGMRFFDNHPSASTTVLFSIGDGDATVRSMVNLSLAAGVALNDSTIYLRSNGDTNHMIKRGYETNFGQVDGIAHRYYQYLSLRSAQTGYYSMLANGANNKIYMDEGQAGVTFNRMGNWSAGTPGQVVGSIHLGCASSTANTSGAITFAARDDTVGGGAGNNAQAGIYVTSDTTYGTRMYIATTNSYATGAQTAISINEAGNVTINRGSLSVTSSIASLGGYSPANGVMRLTPNLHLNSVSGSAIILNWDNGSSGAQQQVRIGNGQGSDAFYFRGDGLAWSSNYGFFHEKFADDKQYFNNRGSSHGAFANPDTPMRFGPSFIQGGGPENNQYYSLSMGLGAEYTPSDYQLQLLWPRYTDYMYRRVREGGSWGQYAKIKAGYADSAGSATYATNAGNASTLAGYGATADANANTIALRNPAGHIYVQNINSVVGNDDSTGIASVVYGNPDGFYRKASVSRFMAVIGASGTNFWTAENRFKSNFNTANGNSPPLQVFSDNSQGAVMAFHRGGAYALNMGLDSDNVFRIGGWSAAANRLQMDMDGNLTMSGNVTAYSDVRIKTNIRTITGALGRVKAMRGVWFDHIQTGKASSGVIAQEFAEHAPELVLEDNSGMKSVNYGASVGYLIEAIKELAEQNAALLARIVELEKQ